MIKAKVVSLTIEEAIGGVTKLDLGTYIDDKELVCLKSVFGSMPWEGLDAVIMTKEEYEALDSVSDFLRKSLLDEREKTKDLKEEVEKLKSANFKLKVKNADFRFDKEIIKEQSETIQKLEEENRSIKNNIRDLEEKMAQDVAEVDIRPGGTIIFRKKRVSELEKEVEKLKEENEALKNKGDEFSLNITGTLFYKED